MIGFYNYALMFSLIQIVVALLGIHITLSHYYIQALICLLLCKVLKIIKNKFKQSDTKEEIDFNKSFQLFIDFMSYGILPIMIVYSFGYTKLLQLIIYAFYIISVVIKLSDISVYGEVYTDTSLNKDYYKGLPIDSIAYILPVLYCLSSFISLSLIQNIFLLVIAVLCVIYLVDIKIRKRPLISVIIVSIISIVFIVFAFINLIV